VCHTRATSALMLSHCSGKGIIVDLTAKERTLTIVGLSVHIPNKTTVGVEVYWRQHSGLPHATNPVGWEQLVSVARVESEGNGCLTDVLHGFKVPISACTTVSFFVFITGGTQLYSLVSGGKIEMGEHISGTVGVALAQRFDVVQGCRKFNGSFHYTVDP